MSEFSYIPGHRNDCGYWTGPRSHCCNAPLVFYSSILGMYVTWDNYQGDEQPPSTLRCKQCNSAVAKAAKEQ
jgi:hypothetical protein